MKYFKKNYLMVLLSTTFLTVSCSDHNDDTIQIEEPSIELPNFVAYNTGSTPLFPEGIEFDIDKESFVISSASTGEISLVSTNGTISQLVSSAIFGGNGTFGLQIDKTHDRLLVVSSNIQNPVVANLFIFKLSDGTLLHNVDLAGLISGLTFINDVAIDNEGNAYVTNSDQGIIFKVDMDGNASIFFNDSAYAPSDPATETGFNGIDFHPNGYLLIVHRTMNKILKLEINNPETLTEVMLPTEYMRGGDGLYVDDNEMVLVNNGAVPFISKFETNDNWNSGFLSGDTYATGDIFPTTVVKVGEDYMINNSYFNFPSYGNTPLNYLISKANFDKTKRYSGTALEIPRINTPVKPILYGENYPEHFYTNCTTSIPDNIPDMQGDWTESTVIIDGTEHIANENPHTERIEQCGNRILVVSEGVLHEVFVDDDTMYNGVNDINPSGMPIHSTGRFEGNTLILTPVFPIQLGISLPDVTRELTQDDNGNAVLKFFNAQLGSIRYLTKN